MSDKMAFDSDIAQEYDKGVRRTLPTYDQLLRLSHTFLRSKLEAEAAVLIVGGGGGNELKTFGPPNPEWRFTAVDPSKAMLEAARMKAQQNDMEERTILIHGTVEDVPEEKLFDAATCLLVLHFVAEVEDKLMLLKKTEITFETWRASCAGQQIWRPARRGVPGAGGIMEKLLARYDQFIRGESRELDEKHIGGSLDSGRKAAGFTDGSRIPKNHEVL